MADFELYYWSVPFRGQFARAVLAFAGQAWTEAGDAATEALMDGPIEGMPVPFMGPPLLVDHRANVAIAQMPAIICYLGETLGLMPSTLALRAFTLKVVNDANDLIDELTLDGGKQMWTPDSWRAYQPRLRKWLNIWEETGGRHGLTVGGGFMLGGDGPGIADVVTATLWTTMTDRFAPIRSILEETAPATAALARRVSGLPALARLAETSRKAYGEVWCGGQIEVSLRRVLQI